jgi:hypothetical protein
MSIKHRKLFYINSRNRTDGADASSCSIVLEIPPHEVFTHVCVIAANIPKSYYLVQAGYNTFTLVEDGTNIVVTIPAGNYNVISFRTSIATFLTASTHGWVYTCTYPPSSGVQTGKFTFSVAGNAGLQPSFIFTTNVYERFGFSANTTQVFVADSLTSTNVVKFQLEDALYLHSDLITDAGSDILQELYTSGTSDFGIVAYRSNEYQVHSKPIAHGTSNVYRFTITDEDDRVMNLNGLDWVATIMVYCENKPLTISMT